jgi:hypothetical protein
VNLQPIYEAAAFDHGFAPIPAPVCPRCVDAAPGPADDLCAGCRGEVARNREDARDELVSVYYSGHGIRHGDYRADVAL